MLWTRAGVSMDMASLAQTRGPFLLVSHLQQRLPQRELEDYRLFPALGLALNSDS